MDKSVVIDGVEYVPKGTVMSDAALRSLSEAYSIAWTNGYYDPVSNHPAWTKTVRDISDHLTEANKELRFKK